MISRKISKISERNIKSLSEVFEILSKDLITSILETYNEQKRIKYDKWELLGDKVIGLSLTKYLIKNMSQDITIGDLTKRISYMVGRESLRLILSDFNFQVPSKWSNKKCGDLLETLIGLSYDSNIQWTEIFLIKIWNKYRNCYKEEISNPKGLLQEILILKQIDYKYYRLNIQPKNIMVRLSIGGHNYYGRATNTKEAEKQAALKALKTRFL